MVRRAVVEIVASGDAYFGVDIRPGKPRLFSSRPNRALVPIGCFDTPPSPKLPAVPDTKQPIARLSPDHPSCFLRDTFSPFVLEASRSEDGDNSFSKREIAL